MYSIYSIYIMYKVYREYISYIYGITDLEFFWNADRELELQVHRKANQKLKYLNK